jgi:hypothetical protein
MFANYPKITKIARYAIGGLFGVMILIMTYNTVRSTTETINEFGAHLNIQDNIAQIPEIVQVNQIAASQESKIKVKSIEVADEIVCNNNYEAKDYSFEFINYEINQDLVILNIKNTGNAIWYGAKTPCAKKIQLGTKREQDRSSIFWSSSENANWVNDEWHNRIILVQDEVLPSETVKFEFKINLPLEEALYREYFGLLIPGFAWLENDFYIDIENGDIDQSEKAKMEFVDRSIGTAILLGEKNIEINLATQTMFLRFGDLVIHSIRVSSGKSSTPTPKDNYTIVNRQDLRTGAKAPYYKMPYWMSLSSERYGFRGYGLHGLPYLVNRKGEKYWDEKNEPGMHLGKPVSHGCVRMEPVKDELVYKFGEIGTKVWVH